MSMLKLTAVYARALIADEKHWTQHVSARNAEGESVYVDSESACCWCARGAIVVAADALVGGRLEEDRLRFGLFEALDNQCGSIVAVNDDKGHAAVLAEFDRFIESCEVGE